MSYGGLADLLSQLALDDLVLRRWTTNSSPEVADGDPVGALETFVRAILSERIELRLSASFIEFFADHPELRVPLSPGALSRDSLLIVQSLKRGAAEVFASSRINTVGCTFTYSRYRGNAELDARFPRRSVILTVLAKGLCVALHRGVLPEFVVVVLCAFDRAAASLENPYDRVFLWRLHRAVRTVTSTCSMLARRPQLEMPTSGGGAGERWMMLTAPETSASAQLPPPP